MALASSVVGPFENGPFQPVIPAEAGIQKGRGPICQPRPTLEHPNCRGRPCVCPPPAQPTTERIPNQWTRSRLPTPLTSHPLSFPKSAHPNNHPMTTPPPRMHPNEVIADQALVRRLIADQFPDWQHLPITPIPYSGTDNAILRLGEDMVVRLPRIHWAVSQVHRDHAWLPVLAPQLPVRVPTPLRIGAPGLGYPWHWAIHEWLPGENAIDALVRDVEEAALDLAAIVAALRRVDPTARAPALSGGRGGPLADRDAEVRAAIASLEGEIDTAGVTAAWQDALAAPQWQGDPVCLHADISPGNLLVNDGRLTALIDFGMLTAGDPATDLMVAWNYLTADTRPIFRQALSVDDATWTRGRGCALSVALIALPYYLHTNPQIVATSRRTIREVLADP